MCKAGKTKDVTVPLERSYRRKSKVALHSKIEDFENEATGGNYFD